MEQGAKLIETCVLYIDIRRSTELNFTHRPKTVAKLYTALVRAMTRIARFYHGHVRGIIGDRVMVIFDSTGCFTNAVHCAIAMNTVSQHIINTRFKANEVTCGIGIDFGTMLATKTGVRRHGDEQSNYRNLAWLGHPANFASKLTDLANKPAETEKVKKVSVAYNKPLPLAAGAFGTLNPPSLGVGLSDLFGSGFGYSKSLEELLAPVPPSLLPDWQWKTETMQGFLSNLRVDYGQPATLVHKDPNFQSFFLTEEPRVVRRATPPILMTERVWNGYRSERPDAPSVKNGWFKPVSVKTPGLTQAVFGGGPPVWRAVRGP
jgi:hypothetical protein